MSEGVRARPAAVALDLGGVLVDVDLAALGRVLDLEESTARAGFFDEGDHDGVSDGSLAVDAFLGRAAERLSAPLDAVRRAWREVVTVRAGARDLVEALGARVVPWSNTDPLHAEVLGPGLAGLLERPARGLSYELGSLKPDPAFYRAGLARLGVAAEEVVFLDDRADNVAAARALGIDAIQTHDLPTARAALSQRELL